MFQFAALLNQLTPAGAEHFAEFLNSASSSDASRAGRWLNSATTTQVNKAAAFLNQGDLDGFRDCLGIGGGFWSWLFGKRKQKKPASAPVNVKEQPKAAKANAKSKKPRPDAKPETSMTICPNCRRRIKYALDLAGKKVRCSKCAHFFRLSPRPEKAVDAVPAPPRSDGDEDWQTLCSYLQGHGPAEINTVKAASAIPVVIQYYEAVIGDQTCPKLTYYLLKASAGVTTAFPYLVVATGEKPEHDRAWNFAYETILKRALPGKTWSDFTWEGSYANHSKPGCQLASTAGFDRLANLIVHGSYQLDRVLRASVTQGGATNKKTQRWDVLIFGEVVVRPELACQICGDNRVAPGFNGSHLRCHACGTIYCKRNCQASIHGQCPRCGETDRIDGVE